jgi:hypothetical protein
MIRDIFEQRLAALSPRQEAKTSALIEEYRKDVAEVQETALRYAHSSNPEAARGLAIIGQLAETAVGTFADAIGGQQPVPETALLFELARGVTGAEAVVVGRLKKSLNDSRMIPQPPHMQEMEEAGPPYRVCDEAYVALRRILNAETLVQSLMESRHFLSLPEADKNSEIEAWMQTGAFTRFLADVDAEEE